MGILALAILEIFAAMVYFSDRPIFEYTGGTWAIAKNLVTGNGYSACDTAYFPLCSSANQNTAMREPIPVLLMAGSMMAYPSIKAGLIVQSLLFLGTLLVIYATLKIYSQPIAILASLLWVTSEPVLSQIAGDAGELASAFFLSLGMFFFMKGIYKPDKTRNWILSGIFMSMAALSRTVILGTSIGLGFIILVYTIYHGRKMFRQNWKKQVRPAFLFLASLLLVYAPWVVRNSYVFKTPVIGSTLAGYNIYRMNFIVAETPFSPHYVGSDDGYTALMQLIQKNNLTGMENEAQMQALYMKAGIQIITQHPVQYIKLSLYRFLPLWFNTSVNASYGIKSTFLDFIATIEQMILLVAIIIGIVKNRKELWPFILILALGSGAYMAVDAQLRYLVSFMPVVVILSASALTTLHPIISHEAT